MAHMFNRRGGWWRLWMTLMVMWAAVVIAYGWLNLPRAQHAPHDPQLLSRLSGEAASILFGSDAKAEPAGGALVWSEDPRIVRMSNGTRLTFPATTTEERIAFVKGEYFQLLDGEAGEQRGPYLLGMLAVGLAPAVLLLVAALAISLVWHGHKPPRYRVIPGGRPPSSIGRTVASALAISGPAIGRMANYSALSAPANRVSPGMRRELPG